MICCQVRSTIYSPSNFMETAQSRRAEPIPLNCPKCGTPMWFHDERVGLDESARPDHVRVYFCYQHGFFHFSDTRQLTEGM
jgi:hypothetical protein